LTSLQATLRRLVRALCRAKRSARHRSRRDQSLSQRPSSGLLPVAIALGTWQLLGRANSRTFPPPCRWAEALTRLYLHGRLTEAVLSTLTTFALALVAATVVGAIIGTTTGSHVGINRAVAPSLDMLASVPGAAVVPLAILALGTTRLTSVAVVALAVVWPILHNSAAAARAIPPVRLEAARTLSLTRLRRWRSVVLPSVASGILLGVRVAASMTLIVTMLVEVLGTGDGIGRLLIERQQHFHTAGAWGLLFVTGVLGYLISLAVCRFDRLFCMALLYGYAGWIRAAELARISCPLRAAALAVSPSW
jgi:sulfonate transport system permease protein